MERDKNIHDILIHLYEWQQLLITWIQSNKKGYKGDFHPSPYNWKTYGEMNVEFWKKHQQAQLDTAKKMLQKSHIDVLTLIRDFSDTELFQKQQFPWTHGSTLGTYCTSVTSSHYDWAIKKLKLHVKMVTRSSVDG